MLGSRVRAPGGALEKEFRNELLFSLYLPHFQGKTDDYYLPPVMMPDNRGRNLLRSQYARMPAAIINAISAR